MRFLVFKRKITCLKAEIPAEMQGGINKEISFEEADSLIKNLNRTLNSSPQPLFDFIYNSLNQNKTICYTDFSQKVQQDFTLMDFALIAADDDKATFIKRFEPSFYGGLYLYPEKGLLLFNGFGIVKSPELKSLKNKFIERGYNQDYERIIPVFLGSYSESNIKIIPDSMYYELMLSSEKGSIMIEGPFLCKAYSSDAENYGSNAKLIFKGRKEEAKFLEKILENQGIKASIRNNV